MNVLPYMGTIHCKGGTISIHIRLRPWWWGGDEPLCRGMEWLFGEILVSLCTTS